VGHSPFPPAEHAAVVAHLDRDHASDLVLLARAFGGGPRVRVVRLEELDQDGLHLRLLDDGQVSDRPGGDGRPDGDDRTDGGVRTDGRRLWVPFPHRLSAPAHLDRELALLVRTARHTLGLPPAADPA
jgi:hypothetical protein